MPFLNLIAPTTFNAKQFDALGDGVTDDSAAITSAISAAVAVGGGIVFFPAGTYITTTQTLVSNVSWAGAGEGATIIKLKNATNGDLLSANTGNINLSGASTTGSSTAITNWGLRDLTLDGNKANQSGTSYCLRVYGYSFQIHNVTMQNGLSGNWLNDWNGPADSTTQQAESQVVNLESYNSGGMLLEYGGPHNTQFLNCFFGYSGNHCVHIASNATSCQWTNCHALVPKLAQTGGAVAWLIEANRNAFVNCDGKDSDTVQVVILAGSVRWNGRIFANGQSASGIQIGQQAGNTPYNGMINQSAGVTTAVTPTMCTIDTLLQDCIGTNGAIWLANDGGQNNVRGIINQASGSYLTGTIASTTQLFVQGTGLTVDGTLAKSPVTALVGQLATSQSATAPVLASSGTITTSGVGVARVAPAANVTGVILQAGTQPGQVCAVINESAFSIVLAASGTSHAADGVADVIGPNASRIYTYDTGTSLWYGTNPVPLQSATAPVLASSGTISTTGLAVSRVAPGGAVTGIVVQAGTYAGQMITIVNESVAANTITLNTTPGTSNVADSATEGNIPGLTARTYCWDSSTALWYRCN